MLQGVERGSFFGGMLLLSWVMSSLESSWLMSAFSIT